MDNKDHGLSSAATLLLLAVFAACSVLTLLRGADIYSGLQARDEAVLDARTAEAYIAARIRSCDGAGSIEVLSEGLEPAVVGPVLALNEDYGGREFATYLYVSDGELCELFAPADAGLDLSDGDPVLAVPELSFEQSSPSMITIRLEGRDVPVALRSGMKGGARIAG